MNIQIFALVGETRLRVVPPIRVIICIYTHKLYNKARPYVDSILHVNVTLTNYAMAMVI